MFLVVFFMCCVLQPIMHYYCVFGKRESLQRFIVEDGAKPAIFGSYSYDPVKQLFIPPPNEHNPNNTSDHTPAASTDQQTNPSQATEETTTTISAISDTDSSTVTVLRTNEKSANTNKVPPRDVKRIKNATM